jgi:hypothetical protein
MAAGHLNRPDVERMASSVMWVVAGGNCGEVAATTSNLIG